MLVVEKILCIMIITNSIADYRNGVAANML